MRRDTGPAWRHWVPGLFELQVTGKVQKGANGILQKRSRGFDENEEIRSSPDNRT